MAQKKLMSESEHLKEVADKVIQKEALSSLNNVRIKYCLVSPEISKKIAGVCIKANKELEYFGDCDFIVEISESIWNALDEERQYLLMFHELLHIKITETKQGELVYKIRKHDVQDFKELIAHYGTDWINEVATIASSIYDIDPDDMEDGISV